MTLRKLFNNSTSKIVRLNVGVMYWKALETIAVFNANGVKIVMDEGNETAILRMRFKIFFILFFR